MFKSQGHRKLWLAAAQPSARLWTKRSPATRTTLVIPLPQASPHPSGGGKTVIPKGAHVTGRVVTAKKGGPAELTVALVSVEIRGKSYPLETNSTGPSGKSQAKNNAKDSAAAKEKKDITLLAETHLKFKLAKSVKVPVKG